MTVSLQQTNGKKRKETKTIYTLKIKNKKPKNQLNTSTLENNSRLKSKISKRKKITERYN